MHIYCADLPRNRTESSHQKSHPHYPFDPIFSLNPAAHEISKANHSAAENPTSCAHASFFALPTAEVPNISIPKSTNSRIAIISNVSQLPWSLSAILIRSTCRAWQLLHGANSVRRSVHSTWTFGTMKTRTLVRTNLTTYCADKLTAPHVVAELANCG